MRSQREALSIHGMPRGWCALLIALALATGAFAPPARAADPFARIAGQPIDRFAGARTLGERDIHVLSVFGSPGVRSDAYKPNASASATQLRTRTLNPQVTFPAMTTGNLVPQSLPDGTVRPDSRDGVITAGQGLSCDSSNGSDDFPGVPDEICLEYNANGLAAPVKVAVDRAPGGDPSRIGPAQVVVGDFFGTGVPQVAIAWKVGGFGPDAWTLKVAFFQLEITSGQQTPHWAEVGRTPSTRIQETLPVVDESPSGGPTGVTPNTFVLAAGDALKTGRDQLSVVSLTGGGLLGSRLHVSLYDVRPGVDVVRVRDRTFDTYTRKDPSTFPYPSVESPFDEGLRMSMATPHVDPAPPRINDPAPPAYDQFVLALSGGWQAGRPATDEVLAMTFDGGSVQLGWQYNLSTFYLGTYTYNGTITEAGDLDGDGFGDIAAASGFGLFNSCALGHKVIFGALDPSDGHWTLDRAQQTVAPVQADPVFGDRECTWSNVAVADTRTLEQQSEAHAMFPEPGDPSNAAPQIHTALMFSTSAGLFTGRATKIASSTLDSNLAPSALTTSDLNLPLVPLVSVIAGEAYDGVFHVGTPRLTSVQTDEPLVVLNASPTQFDVFDGRVFDPNFCYGANLFAVPEVCFFKSTYQHTSSASDEVTSTVNDSWSVGAEASVGGKVGGLVDLKGTLSSTVGQNFSNSASNQETTTVDIAVVAKNTDWAYVLHKQYDSLEYPLYTPNDDPTTATDDGHVLVVRPVVQSRRWIDVNSQASNIRTAHQTGNLLSYAKPEDVDHFPYVAVGTNTFGADSFQISPTSDFTYSLDQEKVTTTGGSTSFKWGIGTKLEASVDLIVEASLTVTGDYNHEDIQTATTSLGDKTHLEARMAQYDGTLGQMNYLVRPFAYYTNTGALVLDYAVEPETTRIGVETFWDRYYGHLPDPTMVLPNYQEHERFGPFALTTDALQFHTRDLDIVERVDQAVCAPVAVPAFEPDPGDEMCANLTVRNLSLKDLPAGSTVRFYAGDPDVGGTPLGSTVLGSIDARGSRKISVPFSLGDNYGDSLVRIFARIDDDDTVAEVKEDNNKGFSTVRVDGWEGAHPYQPRNVYAEQSGEGAVRVIWDAPPHPVPAGSSFEVRAYLDGDPQAARTVTVTPAGIVPGSPYEATVAGLPVSGNYRMAVFTKPGASGSQVGPVSDPSEPVAIELTMASAPTDVTVSNAPQTLGWTAPQMTGSVGGVAQTISKYVVEFSSTGQPTSVDVPAGQTSTAITGLHCGTQYDATVHAVTEQGDGATSAPVTFTYTEPPSPPTNVGTTVNPVDGTTTVTWTAPPAGCTAATGYRVQAQPSGMTVDVGPGVTTATFTGLPLGSAQSFTVSAASAAGASAPSGASTPVAIVRGPDAPAAATATAGAGQATVTWNPPAQTGGSPVTGYSASISGGGARALSSQELPASARSATFTGLRGGVVYTWSVRAINAAGDGAVMTGTVTPAADPSIGNPGTGSPGTGTGTGNAGTGTPGKTATTLKPARLELAESAAHVTGDRKSRVSSAKLTKSGGKYVLRIRVVSAKKSARVRIRVTNSKGKVIRTIHKTVKTNKTVKVNVKAVDGGRVHVNLM